MVRRFGLVVRRFGLAVRRFGLVVRRFGLVVRRFGLVVRRSAGKQTYLNAGSQFGKTVFGRYSV